MKNILSGKSFMTILVGVIVAVAAFVLQNTGTALADNGGIFINVKDELAADLSGANVDIRCPGGTYTSVGTTAISGYVNFLAAGVPVGANCSNGETIDILVAKNGYVNRAATSIGTYLTGSQNSYNVTDVQYSYRVDVLTNELGGNIMPTSGTPWTGESGLVIVDQDYSAGHWYLALTGAGNLAFDLDGYVRANISPTATSVSQTLSTNDFIDVMFSHKVNIVDELGNALTPTTVSGGVINTSCTISGSAAYCPITIATDNVMSSGFIIAKDGYVTNSAAIVPLAANRTAISDNQAVTTMTANNGSKFAVKAILTQADGTALSGATVTTGNGLAVSCTENGSTGLYYCIVPLAHTGVTVNAAKLAYISGSTTFTDRTSATDAQEAASLSLTEVASGSRGGGGSASNTSSEESAADPIIEQPAAPVVVMAPIVLTLEQMIAEEKNYILDPVTLRMNTGAVMNASLEAAMKTKYASLWTGLSGYTTIQMNAVTNFITYGTGTTKKIGAGERVAALSAYKEAYGALPKTAADWENVLNIANGRWPLAVNKAAEARAYITFKTVYGRNADMKNNGDVNALKMMAYGVRATKARDLKAEAGAAARYKSFFGFAPTTARHWNIVRAIAYSGVIK